MSKGSYYRAGMSDAQREAYNKYKREQNRALREKYGYRQRTSTAIEDTQPIVPPVLSQKEMIAAFAKQLPADAEVRFEELGREAMRRRVKEAEAETAAQMEKLALERANNPVPDEPAPVKKDLPPWETTDMLSVERVAEDVTYQNAPNDLFRYAVRMAYKYFPKDQWTTKKSTKMVVDFYGHCKKWHDEHSPNTPTENE